MLDPTIFKQISGRFFHPEINLMASSLTTQVPQFVSWKADCGAITSYAFHIPWANIKVYIFQPFGLIAKVLVKAGFDGMLFCIIILPLQKTQQWYPKLLKLLVAPPLLLPKQKKNLLRIPNSIKIYPLCMSVNRSSLQNHQFLENTEECIMVKNA